MRAPPTALVPEPVMGLRVPMETGIIVNVVDQTRMITPGHLVEKEQIGLGIKHGSEVVQKPSRLHLHTAKHLQAFAGSGGVKHFEDGAIIPARNAPLHFGS